MTFFGAALLTAITTAVLAVGAIFTAVFAVRAFRVQSRQLDLQQQQLKDQREDSAKQAKVLELQAAGLHESLREAREPAEIFAHVKNISEQPLYDVTLQWWPEPGLGPLDDEKECAKVKSAVQLIPGEDLSDTSGTLGPYACWSVIFRDRTGVCWRVHPNERPRIVGEKWFPGTSTPAVASGGGSRRV